MTPSDIKEAVKASIYWKLTFLRDHEWLPNWLIEAIDWLRYEVFYTEEL